MFGFSFWKIVVLVGVISIVWFGFRWFQRWQAESEARLKAAAQPPRTGRQLPAETMVACRVCGTYVVAGSPSCGRRGCPYPG